MRVVVVAETVAKYLDWCALHRLHPRAARYTPERPELAPDDVLVDLRSAALSQNLEAMVARAEAA